MMIHYSKAARFFGISLIIFQFIFLFSKTQNVAAQSSQALLGAKVQILADGTVPWEDHVTTGVHDAGDDFADNNRIVRTLDKVIYNFSFSINSASAQNMVITAALSNYAVWDTKDIEAFLTTLCVDGWNVSGDGKLLTCNLGTQTPKTVDFSLPALASFDGPNESLFHVTLNVVADNGIPNPDVNECAASLSKGCQAVSDNVAISSAVNMGTMKIGVRWGPWDTPESLYENSVTYNNTSTPYFTITYYLIIKAGSEGDIRGSGPVSESTIGTLHDWWKAWKTSNPSEVITANATLDSCSNNFSLYFENNPGLLDRTNPSMDYLRYVSTSNWSCSQPGGAGTPINVNVSNLDINRMPPIYALSTWNGTKKVGIEGIVAIGQIKLKITRAQVEALGGDITIENCFATAPGDKTAAEFNPTDLGGAANNFGVAEDLSDNCARVRLQVPTGLPGKAYWNKTYQPLSGNNPTRVVEGSEYFARIYFENYGSSSSSDDVEPITDVILCDKFDNRTQTLNGEAYHTWPSSPSTAETGPIQYGVGNWGLQSGIPYDKNAAWDATWYQQSHLHCEDNDPVDHNGDGILWYSASQIDWTNSDLPNKVNARDINAVRSVLSTPVENTHGTYFMIPLRALANEKDSWLMNYGDAKFRESVLDVADWRNTYLSRTYPCGCANADTTNGLCPQNYAYFINYAPGYCGQALLQTNVKADVTKTNLSGATKFSGDTIRWRIVVDTLLNSSGNIIYPSTSELTARNVVVTDLLPADINYVEGSATVNGKSFEPVISTAPATAPYPGATNKGEMLTFSLGDLKAGLASAAVIEFTTVASPLIQEGSSRENQTYVTLDSDSVPPNCTGFFANNWEKCYRATVSFVALTAAAVDKQTVNDYFLPGDNLKMALIFGRLRTTAIAWVDFVDILPYNGDSRGSNFLGQIQLTSITPGYSTYSAPDYPYQIWASAIPPQELDARGTSLAGDDWLNPATIYGWDGAELGVDDNGDGIIDWPCQLSIVQAGLCADIPSMADITALRFYGPKPSSGNFIESTKGPYAFTLNFDTTKSIPGDYYKNSYGGNFEGMPLGVKWEDHARTESIAIGDLVFFDRNDDGKFDSKTDSPLRGVIVNLLDSSGNPIEDPDNPGHPYQVTTNSNGRYIFSKLLPGQYIIEIDQSNFTSDGVLYNMVPSSITESGSADNDLNEDEDNNAGIVYITGAVRSGILTLVQNNEPLNDAVDFEIIPLGVRDSGSNLTVDFGFVDLDETDPDPDGDGDEDDNDNPVNVIMPDTGFAPGRFTYIEPQLEYMSYSENEIMELRIGSIDLKAKVVSIPRYKNSWDIRWLNKDLGWLEGSAFPTWKGNSILTGHLYLSDGTPGPFIDLKRLKWGDKIDIYAFGQIYHYEVRGVFEISKNDTKFITKHEKYPWITLVTCENFDEATQTYLNRLIIRAVQTSIE